MRQKIELELAFPPIATGEARSGGAAETEAEAANAATESPAVVVGPSMEPILERDNLRKALARVRRNKGAPGIDGMTVDDLAAHLKDHWPADRYVVDIDLEKFFDRVNHDILMGLVAKRGHDR